MVHWLSYEREMLKDRFLEIAYRMENEKPVTDEEHALMENFNLLNPKRCLRSNIEEFFELLDEVVYQDNKRGDYAENH